MAATIVQRNYNGIQDNRAAIPSGIIITRRFVPPVGWLSLRVGIRMMLNGTASVTGSSYILFLLGNHTSQNQNCIGFLNGASGWSYNAASGGNSAYYAQTDTNNWVFTGRSGSTVLGSSFVNGTRWPADATIPCRRFLFMTFTRPNLNASASWTVNWLLANTTGPASSVDFSQTDFYNYMSQPLAGGIVPSGHVQSTNLTQTFDETLGVLDTLYLNLTTAAGGPAVLEVSDIGVSQLA